MKSLHILLVEDNEGDIILTTEALAEGGFQNNITVARDGYRAAQYLENARNGTKPLPDIILLDINLPKLNGHEVLKKIKYDEKIMHIPVIMLSTSSSAGDIQRSYENYANCYIIKPIDIEEFFQVIYSMVKFWTSTVKLPLF